MELSNSDLTIYMIVIFTLLIILSLFRIYACFNPYKLTGKDRTCFKYEVLSRGLIYYYIAFMGYFDQEVDSQSELAHAIRRLPEIKNVVWVTKSMAEIELHNSLPSIRRAVKHIRKLLAKGLNNKKEKECVTEHADSAG